MKVEICKHVYYVAKRIFHQQFPDHFRNIVEWPKYMFILKRPVSYKLRLFSIQCAAAINVIGRANDTTGGALYQLSLAVWYKALDYSVFISVKSTQKVISIENNVVRNRRWF